MCSSGKIAKSLIGVFGISGFQSVAASESTGIEMPAGGAVATATVTKTKKSYLLKLSSEMCDRYGAPVEMWTFGKGDSQSIKVRFSVLEQVHERLKDTDDYKASFWPGASTKYLPNVLYNRKAALRKWAQHVLDLKTINLRKPPLTAADVGKIHAGTLEFFEDTNNFKVGDKIKSIEIRDPATGAQSQKKAAAGELSKYVGKATTVIITRKNSLDEFIRLVNYVNVLDTFGPHDKVIRSEELVKFFLENQDVQMAAILNGFDLSKFSTFIEPDDWRDGYSDHKARLIRDHLKYLQENLSSYVKDLQFHLKCGSINWLTKNENILLKLNKFVTLLHGVAQAAELAHKAMDFVLRKRVGGEPDDIALWDPHLNVDGLSIYFQKHSQKILSEIECFNEHRAGMNAYWREAYTQWLEIGTNGQWSVFEQSMLGWIVGDALTRADKVKNALQDSMFVGDALTRAEKATKVLQDPTVNTALPDQRVSDVELKDLTGLKPTTPLKKNTGTGHSGGEEAAKEPNVNQANSVCNRSLFFYAAKWHHIETVKVCLHEMRVVADATLLEETYALARAEDKKRGLWDYAQEGRTAIMELLRDKLMSFGRIELKSSGEFISVAFSEVSSKRLKRTIELKKNTNFAIKKI